MKITIWTLVHDSDAGTRTEVFTSQAQLDARACEIMTEAWRENNWPDQPPTDWREAWELIDAAGCDFWISTDEHEITLP